MGWNIVWGYAIITTGKHHASYSYFIWINTLSGLFLSACLEMTVKGVQTEGVWFTRKPDLMFEMALKSGLPMALANYSFNLGIFISTNPGVSIIISQLTILVGYLISIIRYN